MKKLILTIALTFCAIVAVNAQVQVETKATSEQMEQYVFMKLGIRTDEQLKNVEITDTRKVKDPKQTNATLVAIDGKLYLSDSFQQAVANAKVTPQSHMEFPPAIVAPVKERLKGKGGELFDIIVIVESMEQLMFTQCGIETNEKLKNAKIIDIRKDKDPKQTNATLVAIGGKMYLSDSHQQAIAYTKVTVDGVMEYPPALALKFAKPVKERLKGKGGELFDKIVIVMVKK